jgi:hypothetical protein
MTKWIGGERVTREIYMDDGTWEQRGDKCLASSPLRHGTVLLDSQRKDSVWVKWDDGITKQYLNHGIDPE